MITSATASTGRLPVPPLGPPSALHTPEIAERALPSGLTVKVVRRAAVPLVELRLRIPTVGDTAILPVSTLLADTTLSGTAARSNIEIAAALQEVGGDLDSSIDADRLLFAGNSLASGLPRLLDVLADVLTGASYPDREVVVERDRVVDSIQVALAQPATAARRAVLRRLFGSHPYGTELPDPAEVAEVQPEALRKLHSSIVVPRGAVLVVVGDIDPERGLDQVEQALSGWTTPGAAGVMPPVPHWSLGPWQIANRPGAVQSSIRIAAPAVGRSHPDYPALQVANLIFGGYFSSRLVYNIREDKGYTYSPHSTIDHSSATSVIMVDADVATEVTAPALHEINYELGRIATTAVTADELEDARQYAVGTLALSTATQGGLANWITLLSGQGLDVSWLEQYAKRVSVVTAEEVQAAAGTYLAPSAAITSVLGDAERIGGEVSRLHAVEVI